jgi:hypothetical protein
MDREAQHHMFEAAMESVVADEPINEVVEVALSVDVDRNWVIAVRRSPLPRG